MDYSPEQQSTARNLRRHSEHTYRRSPLRHQQQHLRGLINHVNRLSDDLNRFDHRVMVLIQHRRSPPQQIPPQLLRFQISDLPHNASHDLLHVLQPDRDPMVPDPGRALKSVVQGLLLTSESEKLHSMNLLLYMAPMAAFILLPFSLYIEGNVLGKTVEKVKGDAFMVFLLIGNATVAYLVNLTNFLVTKHTSALTLQVLGNAKAAVAAVVSVLIFRNPVTVMGISGFAVTIMGVVLYSEARKRSKVTVH
ncbi:hypothetical protein L1987_17708 [Smallanthus sonchifolius]|uniref:Uncharacterized protein n=1 Tax=Smallanthus sonchifolius TaxID=185202 RepID=A0ACB9IZP6_9ASTR|nr:hypothetical protein L1987_17708 [Smallanthus sonchifolius]